MVIGLFIITAIPTVTGVAQAISAQKNREQRLKDEKRMRKFNIDVYSEDQNLESGNKPCGRLVVEGDRVWIGPPDVDQEGAYGYVCECMIVEYPDPERIPVSLGLVSQVQKTPPLLNWIYVDRDTKELKYGNKSASIAHHIGSWDWTEDEQFLTFEELCGGQGEDFIAVANQAAGRLQLFYDIDGDELQGTVYGASAKFSVRLRRTVLPQA